MFTGLIECIGIIISTYISEQTNQTILIINSDQKIFKNIQLGDSIAVDGVCLTVIEFDLELFNFKVGLSPETIKRTTLSTLIKNSKVNLESSLTLSTKIGGHYVQGHVDCTGIIIVSEINKDSLKIKIKIPEQYSIYIVEKGYICIDGISLTVVNITEDIIEIMLIQYTQKNVVLSQKNIGDIVNIETDIIS